MAKATRESDPLVGWQFVLEINKLPVGYFSECSGIGSETEIIEHKTLDKNGVEVVQKIPGRLKWGDVTLKRGITNSLAVYQWRTRFSRFRRSLTIASADTKTNPARTLWK